jgi:hypothetical protein
VDLCLGRSAATEVLWEVAPSSASTGVDKRRGSARFSEEIEAMSEDIRWLCGFDWASQKHHGCVLDAAGRRLGERDVEHGGAGLGEFCDWLIETTGGTPAEIAVAIETSSGPVVETFLERGFRAFSLNPKQLDRFRDRFSVAGAKDEPGWLGARRLAAHGSSGFPPAQRGGSGRHRAARVVAPDR